jgi:aspartate aminotransferase
MKLASRLKKVKPSSTLAVTAKVLELKRQGREVIGFAAGEPDFDTWPHVCEAAHEAIRRGAFRYTAVGGTPELKDAIVTKLARDNSLEFVPSEVIATCGGKHALFNVLQATLDPGDEVVIPGPYWVSYADMVLLAEGKPKIAMAAESRGFKLAPSELDAAIGPKTKLVIINSPSNPTGATYTEAEMVELARVLMKHPHVWVMVDDVYEFIRYDGKRPRHLLALEPGLRDRIVVVNSVSKTYAMTGWRIGYAAGPTALVGAISMLQGQQTSNPSTIAQAAAVAALTGSQDALGPMVAEFHRRRDFICDGINAIDGLSVVRPDGAFYVFVNARDAFARVGAKDGDDFAFKMLESASVGTVGGNDFGSPDHFRISYATSMDQLERGLDAISRWLKK